MSYDQITSGSLIDYHFLWKREELKGETEGRKSRPACVVVRTIFKDQDVLLILPITTKEPPNDVHSIHVPDMEAKRLKMENAFDRWIILDEVNIDRIPSTVLVPDAFRGQFSKAFLKQITIGYQNAKREMKQVSRI